MDARIVDGRKIARVTDDGKLKVLVHGRDGDDLVPVKVSEDGYLMLATDVTVEGVTVDLGTVELNQGAPGQNPWPVTLSGTIVELATGSNIEVTAGSTVTLYENTTKQYPARSIRAAAVGYSNFDKAQLAIRFWGNATRMSSYLYAFKSEVVEANGSYIREARAESDVYGGFCRVTLTNLMTTNGTLASFVVLGVI